ncbi:MAG: type IV pilin-like G/H family protein [Microcoleus sp.]
MSDQDRINKVLKALQDGTESVRQNPSEDNYQTVLSKIERAGQKPNFWGRAIAITLSGAVGLSFIVTLILISYESTAKTNIENLCRSQWQFYYKNGRMYNNLDFYINTDGKYNYTWVKYPYFYNVAVMYAQPREKGLKSFVGIAFAPAGNKQRNYSCQICKSKSPNAYMSLPVSTSSGLNCPSNYDFVKVINN